MDKIMVDPALAQSFLDDEDFSGVFGFDEKDAWERLHSLPNVIEISINSQHQKELAIAVGRNVSDQHRWKAIRKDTLEQWLQPSDEKGRKLAEMLQELEEGAQILLEYVPERSGRLIGEDVFLIYANVEEVNEASEIVRKLELLERLKLKLTTEKIFKKRWESKATADEEIEHWKRVPAVSKVTTELMTIVPVPKRGKMCLRTVEDARDGFVELLPVKWRTSNMPRKVTDRGTQVRPVGKCQHQQTEPTFPSNAATQYEFDATDDQVDPEAIPATWLENSGEFLSKEAQFNLIGLYNNEYGRISTVEVQGYETPRFDEMLSFMNRSICIGRSVRSLDWHPKLSGIFVASYTFETLLTVRSKVAKESSKPSEDLVKRMIFEKCPVLVWSFVDPLEPLLELKTIREVTSVSFCPYDGELVVGGLANGQLVLWDLRGEIDRVETAQRAAHEANEQRKEIRQLMETSEEAIDRSVSPAAVSSLEHAARGAITSIKWLPRNHFCTTTGHLKMEAGEQLHRFVMTTSLDGTVCFWDLDFSMPALQKMIAAQKGSKMVEKTIYQTVNNLFFPTFKLLGQTAMTAVVVNEAVYLSIPQGSCKDIMRRVEHDLQPLAVDCKMSLTLGTFTGQLLRCCWEGYEFEQGTLVNDEPLQVSCSLSAIHDGPIVALERNPTARDAFLSIGGHVLALWSEEDFSSPIFWRKKSAPITAGRWSLDRVSVFFVGLANGDFEIWDLNMKTFRACVSLNLGADTLTAISQHRLASARRCLAVADGNANVRILALPVVFMRTVVDEELKFREMIHHELDRKASQAAWTKAHNELNPVVAFGEGIEGKIAEQKKAVEGEKRTEVVGVEGKKLRDAEKRMPLSDRLDQRYRAKQFQIFLNRLMQRRNVSPERMAREMRPEVERRKYAAEKRAAIEANISRANGEFVNVQRVLRPAEKSPLTPVVEEEGRTEKLQKIAKSIGNYRQVEAEAQQILRDHYLPQMESFAEVLVKSRERREKVCVKVGTNMEHSVAYEEKRSLRRRGIAPRTLLVDLEPISEEQEGAGEGQQSEGEE